MEEGGKIIQAWEIILKIRKLAFKASFLIPR
jgi:hypothetical protein